jgi:hypothetical protein
MKNEQNHGLSTFDFITMVFSFVVIICVTSPILTKNIQSKNIELAQREASHIAKSLSDMNVLHTIGLLDTQKKRGVASVDLESAQSPIDLQVIKRGTWDGVASRDPWGAPYHYLFMRDVQGRPSQIIVWSEGPNHTDDSNVPANFSTTQVEPGIFKGDDLGSVVPVR